MDLHVFDSAEAATFKDDLREPNGLTMEIPGPVHLQLGSTRYKGRRIDVALLTDGAGDTWVISPRGTFRWRMAAE